MGKGFLGVFGKKLKVEGKMKWEAISSFVVLAKLARCWYLLHNNVKDAFGIEKVNWLNSSIPLTRYLTKDKF